MVSSRSFDSLAEPQHGQVSGAGMTTRSRDRCSGNGFRLGGLRSKDLIPTAALADFTGDSLGADFLTLWARRRFAPCHQR